MKTSGDRYLQYMAGWHAGAGCKSIDPKRAEHEDEEFAAIYREGWYDGNSTAQAVALNASRRFGYKPSMIRVAKRSLPFLNPRRR